MLQKGVDLTTYPIKHRQRRTHNPSGCCWAFRVTTRFWCSGVLFLGKKASISCVGGWRLSFSLLYGVSCVGVRYRSLLKDDKRIVNLDFNFKKINK